jgi:hypothetical protein
MSEKMRATSAALLLRFAALFHDRLSQLIDPFT